MGPLVEGEDEAKLSRRTGPLRAPGEIRASFLRNLGYFWVGRFAGALAYFFPAVLAVILSLELGPRARDGWLALAALGLSWLFYIWMIPDNWYGGGGTVGNRYFLNLLPLAVLAVPRGREWMVAIGGGAVSAAFLLPMWLAPLHHSLRPGAHAVRAPFRWLPAELTMLNDLSAFTEGWRKKRPYGDTEGDPRSSRPAEPTAYYLYFLGSGTTGKDVRDGHEGFRVLPGGRPEVVLRALEPVRTIDVRLAAGRTADELTVAAAGESRTVRLAPGQLASLRFQPGPGFQFYDSFLYVLRFRSRSRGPADPAAATFVELVLDVEPRSGPAGPPH
jgi:hypothetical protein